MVYSLKELHFKYPNSKFILTMRDEAEWAISIKNHFGQNLYPYHDLLYTPKSDGELNYIDVYRKHNDEVKIFFENKSNFITFDLGRDGWDKLCLFLDRNTIKSPFPSANKAANKGTIYSKVKMVIKWMYYK